MLQKADVVLFDFDGTLSAHDSNVEFAKYCLRHSPRTWLFLPMILVGAIMLIFNSASVRGREIMRRYTNEQMLKKFVPSFAKEYKRERFGWAADQVRAEHNAGRIVILVSASADYLIHQLVRDMKFDAVLCSRMNPKKPWKYEFLCWGANKVIAIDTWARRNKIIPRVVRAYSDSKSDMPMMELAAEQVWIDAKTGLRKHA